MFNVSVTGHVFVFPLSFLARQVKNSPSCLGYDSSTFRATFEAFAEVFSPEDTKGMVTRNPNLLAVKPTGFGGACNAKSDTMQMSYVIAFTRWGWGSLQRYDTVVRVYRSTNIRVSAIRVNENKNASIFAVPLCWRGTVLQFGAGNAK